MSADVDYFFNSDLNLEELVEKINEMFGCRLSPIDDEPNSYSAWFFGTNLFLTSDHGFVPDRELNFDYFRYQIGVSYRSINVEILTLVAFQLYSKFSVKEGMLVFDVQILLARYHQRGKDWCDEVSGKMVSFPSHFLDINSRLPFR